MAYLDPVSNSGSKPQRLSDRNCQCTWKQNKKMAFCVTFWPKTICSMCNFCKRNHWTFEENKDRNQWLVRKCAVLMVISNQPSNLSSALMIGTMVGISKIIKIWIYFTLICRLANIGKWNKSQTSKTMVQNFVWNFLRWSPTWSQWTGRTCCSTCSW